MRPRPATPTATPSTFLWWVYAEAGTGSLEPVRLDAAAAPRVTVHVPRRTASREIHVVLEVTDRGDPPLTRYRRVVLRVNGS